MTKTKQNVTSEYEIKRNDSLQVLQKHREAISAKENEITTVQSSIAVKRNELNKIEASTPTANHLNLAREDLLAAISLGNKTNEDLIAFDKQNAGELNDITNTQQLKKQSKVTINQAIKGLERKLSQINSELTNLKSKDSELVVNFLMDDANVECEKYLHAATVLREHYMNLYVINDLLKSHGKGEICQFNADLYLPTIRLPQSQDYFYKNSGLALMSDFLLSVYKEKDKSSETYHSKLKEFGILI